MNKSKYIIIETSTNKPSADMNGEVRGPFRSAAKAEQWILDDALDNYSPAEEGPPEEWGSVMYICEIKRIVRPVPEVNVKVRVKDIECKEVVK